jgi:hypothetical protein
LVSKGYCCKPRWSIGTKKPSAPPSGLDFDLWLGPAPEQPYHGNLVHYNWHWFWDMGNGDIGNQGVHEMDVARWAIKGATLPKSRATSKIETKRPLGTSTPLAFVPLSHRFRDSTPKRLRRCPYIGRPPLLGSWSRLWSSGIADMPRFESCMAT